MTMILHKRGMQFSVTLEALDIVGDLTFGFSISSRSKRSILAKTSLEGFWSMHMSECHGCKYARKKGSIIKIPNKGEEEEEKPTEDEEGRRIE